MIQGARGYAAAERRPAEVFLVGGPILAFRGGRDAPLEERGSGREESEELEIAREVWHWQQWLDTPAAADAVAAAKQEEAREQLREEIKKRAFDVFVENLEARTVISFG